MITKANEGNVDSAQREVQAENEQLPEKDAGPNPEETVPEIEEKAPEGAVIGEEAEVEGQPKHKEAEKTEAEEKGADSAPQTLEASEAGHRFHFAGCSDGMVRTCEHYW